MKKILNMFRLFYDPKFYKELLTKHAHPIRQVFILILISTIAYSVFYGKSISTMLKEGKEFILTEIEEFKLEEGKLFVNQKDTTLYENDKLKIVVDTEDKYDENNIQDEKVIIYIDEEKVLIKKNDIELRGHMYAGDIKTIDNKYIAGIMDKIRSNVYLIAIPALIVQMLFKWFYVLVIGAIGIVVLKIMKVEIKFKQVLKISAYILTIPTVLTILNVFVLNVLIPALSRVNILIIILYFIVIGKSLKKSDKQ